MSSLVIDEGTLVRFDPTTTTTLSISGNVVVRGTLEMLPASPDVVHTLRFIDVDESRFVGGGEQVLPTDIGLWVRETGQLNLRGATTTPWSRAAAPDWTDADSLILCPTGLRDFSGFRSATVSSLPDPLPSVSGAGHTWTAEVLNLTRNVRVEGTPGHRAHIHIMSMMRQTVRYVELSYLGPRQANSNGFTDPVLGRYALHFHMAGAGVSGTVVEGVVAHDCGNHSFVPHMSNGVTFKQCVAYNVFEEPFWWDVGDPSDDVVWQDCVAALVQTDPPFEGFRLNGFTLGVGTGNQCTGCVAVGVQGNKTSAGFTWPEISKNLDEGIWVFRDCVAHNNQENGIFVWQNTKLRHVISRFAAYRNGRAGTWHGAYVNPYVYRASTLFQNSYAGVSLVARSLPFGELQFNNVTIDGGGVTRYGFIAQQPQSGLPGGPALVRNCTIAGVRVPFALAYTFPPDRISNRFTIVTV